jgi:hypothetical protein
LYAKGILIGDKFKKELVAWAVNHKWGGHCIVKPDFMVRGSS